MRQVGWLAELALAYISALELLWHSSVLRHASLKWQPIHQCYGMRVSNDSLFISAMACESQMAAPGQVHMPSLDGPCGLIRWLMPQRSSRASHGLKAHGAPTPVAAVVHPIL